MIFTEFSRRYISSVFLDSRNLLVTLFLFLTSPWIALSICAKTELLKQLYEEVYMPIGVKEEILIGVKQKS